MSSTKDGLSKAKSLIRKWRKQQRACREQIERFKDGRALSSCCNMEAHYQVVRTLGQCIRELKEAHDC